MLPKKGLGLLWCGGRGFREKKSTPARPAQPSGELPEFEVPADSPVEEEATSKSKEIPVEMTAAEQRAALAEQVFKQHKKILPDKELTPLPSSEHPTLPPRRPP